MQTTNQTVAALKKVVLTLSARPCTKGEIPEQGMTIPLTVIVGLGVNGITPFERALIGKGPGDTVSLHLDTGCNTSVFGHLYHEVCHALPIAAPFDLRITIDHIATADSREVVKALARMGGCGGGCDCGCGG